MYVFVCVSVCLSTFFPLFKQSQNSLLSDMIKNGREVQENEAHVPKVSLPFTYNQGYVPSKGNRFCHHKIYLSGIRIILG